MNGSFEGPPIVGGLPSSRADELEHEVEHLRQALVSRADIDQAKGMLMLRYGIDAGAAFDVLRRWSSQTNTKVAVLAQQLIDGAATGDADVLLERLVCTASAAADRC